MPLAISFKDAALSALALAKVGNPLRSEPLQVSRSLCRFEDSEAEVLTRSFLRSFRSLELHQLHHHSKVEDNELHRYASAIFRDNGTLLEQSASIARHLQAKSSHPAIKPGDLCVALIDDVLAAGQRVQALSLIKSESKVPFLQISERDGDLRLTTEQGIYPDKIDKGCLIVNHDAGHGYAVYLFDKSGGDTRFWNRDFVGAVPVKSDDYLTRHFAKLCASFADKGLPEDTTREERVEVAARSVSYLEETEDFALDDFQAKALETPERIARFTEFKAAYEEESGSELEDRFTVSKAEAGKARKRLKSRMKLDVGVELRFSSGFLSRSEQFLERGRDEDKDMEYVKIWFHKEE